MALNVGTLVASLALDTRPMSAGAVNARNIVGRLSGQFEDNRNRAEALGRSIRGLGDAFRGAGGAGGRFGGTIASLGGAGGPFGIARLAVGSFIRELQILTGIFSAGLFGRLLFRQGIEFQQNMQVARETTQATAEEFDQLKQAAFDMAEVTEFSAVQSADALRLFGLAGFNAAEAIQILPDTLDLATAGMVDLKAAADFMAITLRSFRLPAEDSVRVLDTIALVAARTNVEMREIIESFKFAAPAARNLGAPLEELAVIIGVLADTGIRGAIAGTQLGRAYEQANSIAVDFNLESAKFVDVLEELVKRGASVQDFFALFDIRGGRAALSLSDLTKHAREMTEAMEKAGGEGRRLATAFRDTVGKAFQNLQAIITDVLIKTFEELEDQLRDIIGGIRRFILDNQELIISFISQTLLLLLAIGRVAGAITGHFKGLGDDIRRFSQESATSYSGLRSFIERDSKGIREAIDKATPLTVTEYDKFAIGVAEVFRRVLITIYSFSRQLSSLIFGIVKILVTFALAQIRAMFDLLQAASATIGGFFESIRRGSFQAAGEFISAGIRELESARDRINAANADIRETFFDMVVNINEAGKDADNAIFRFGENMEDRVVEMQRKVEEALTKFGDSLSKGGVGAVRRLESLASPRLLTSPPPPPEPRPPIGRILFTPDELKRMEKATLLATQRVADAIVSIHEELLKETGLTNIQVFTRFDSLVQAITNKILADAEALKRELPPELGAIVDQVSKLKIKAINIDDFIEPTLDKEATVLRSLLKSTAFTKDQMLGIFEELRVRSLAIVEKQIAELKAISPEFGAFVEPFLRAADLDELDKLFKDITGSIEESNKELVRSYQELLDETGITRDRMLSLWDDYQRERLEQIRFEGDALRKSLEEIGASSEQIEKIVQELTGKRIRDLNAEFFERMKETAGLVRKLYDDTAQGMADAMETFFLDAMRDEFKSFYDYLLILSAQVMRRIAQEAANAISDILFGFQSGGGGLFSELGRALIGAFSSGGDANKAGFEVEGFSRAQHGGIFTRPTLTLIGEAGPEAVVPLNNMFPSARWHGFGWGSGGNRDVTVVNNMNIQTPDPPSFRASSGQIMAQMSIASQRAMMRNS